MKTTTYFKASLSMAALVILSLLNARNCEAQITITSSDIPSIGSIFIDVNDTLPTVTPGGSGPGQTWDLSALHSDATDSVYFLSASSTPYFSFYPTSNLAIKSSLNGLGLTYEYSNLSADSLLVEGAITSALSITEIGLEYPSVIGNPFPATYLTNWHGSYINVEKYSVGGGDSVKGVILYSYFDTVDAWGSVTTPAGVYSNSLRIKQINYVAYDSVYEYISGSGWFSAGTSSPVASETYEWVVNGGDYQVAELSLDTAGKSVSSGGYLLKKVTGIEDLKNNLSADAYPNPASSSIIIQVKSVALNGFIKVTDITGRIIENSKFANSRAELNTFGYPNGMYIYEITDMSGNLVDKGKFSVNH